VTRPTGFMEHNRQEVPHRLVAERVRDFLETDLPLSERHLVRQAARCMDCGVPFCHGVGCPVGNRIPEFNDLIHRGRWRDAAENLHSTNNFPEITGRVCPAPCEAACTLAINADPVLIKHVELQIAERAFAEGWVAPMPARRKTGRRVAVVGSGPAGLAAAQQLARAGHHVVVFEKDDRVGGLLRYGIPDFKLDKRILDRRLEQLAAEGVEFQTAVAVGQDISARYLRTMFDAVCLTMGAAQPRDLDVPGRQGAENVLMAMDFLTRQNRLIAGDRVEEDPNLSARDKIVVVIGGGDTGSDCVGTSLRQGASQVHQLEILPKPPETCPDDTPWPAWPRILRTTTSHEEGCDRRWSMTTISFSGAAQHVESLTGCQVEWVQGPSGWQAHELPDTEFTIEVDVVLLAMGFMHVVHGGLVDALGLALDGRGNVVAAPDGATSREGTFAAGDTASGASLVVRAIYAGRQAAEGIDRWLKKS